MSYSPTISNFFKDETGAVFIEFAAIITICSFVLLSTVELGYYILQARQAEKTANSLTNIVQSLPQNSQPSTVQLNAFGEIIETSFALNETQYKIILTAFEDYALGSDRVMWQESFGSLTATSLSSPDGNTLSALPSGKTDLDIDEEIVSIEVFWQPQMMTGLSFFDQTPQIEQREIYFLNN